MPLTVDAIDKLVGDALTRRRDAKARHAEAKQELAKAEAEVANRDEALTVARGIAAAIQQQAHDKIARIVTRCLSDVFEESYEFRINFVERRGKTEADLVFWQDGHEIDPLNNGSGGVVDIAAFALRVACLVMARPALRRLLVLDEPFRFVEKPRLPAVAAMVQSLADELGIQFVIVTHLDALKIGQVIRISPDEE